LIWLIRRAALVMVVLGLAGCGATTVEHVTETRAARTTPKPAATSTSSTTASVHVRPQVVEPSAGSERTAGGSGLPSSLGAPAASVTSGTPIGDPNAHAPPLSEVRRQLRMELVSVRKTSATYINPLHYVTCCGVWERTDQGVDATMPVGSPILAPCRVKILGIVPNWYVGQPLVYYELLEGPQAGKIQYVAEEITQLARPGSILQQGQPIARFSASGTGIEFGWSTINGVTLARATTGYGEGQATPAGRSIRAWLNALGARAGNG
jgi:hypothetical protein